MQAYKLLAREGAMKLVFLQCAVTLFVSVLCLLFLSVIAAYSALMGGGICILGTAYFAYRVFKHQGARAARQIMKSVYIGEAVKLLLSALLFTLVFTTMTIDPLTLFVGFIVAQMLYWVAPWLFTQ